MSSSTVVQDRKQKKPRVQPIS